MVSIKPFHTGVPVERVNIKFALDNKGRLC
jgi:hypothetical protein